MKRLFIVSAIFMCALCLYAQNNAARNKGVIQVEQYFHGWTHCNKDDKPAFGTCTITNKITNEIIHSFSSTSTSTTLRKMIGITPMFVSDDGIVFIDSEKTQKLSLKISHSANDIGDDIDDYNMEMLHLGFNRSEPHSISDHCWGTKDEGYEVSTTVIVDNPVEIIPKKDNSSLCIDDGDKCEFRLNNFYVTANTEFYFSVKLTSEDDKSWRKTTRTFKPNQEIALSYDEIRSIAGINDEFAWSGKNISIKITKKLIDGSWTESNVVLCKFIHNGPNFEVKTVRRSYCSNAVKLQVVSENLSSYSNSRFNWEVAQKENEDSLNLKQHSVDEFKRTTTPNLYDLSINDVDFATDVFEDENNPEGSKYHWFLQLQEKDSSTLKFTTKQFEIAPRAPQITISQYTDASTEVESGLDPYIRIKIEDLDTYYDNGRVPYKVYEVYDENGKNKEEYLTEFNNRIDATEFNEEELKNDFNSDNPDHSLDITESSYIQNKFHEWYENEKNSPAVKTIKVSGSLSNESQSGVGKVTESANVMCVDSSTLYFYGSLDGKSIWHKIEFSSTKYPIGTTKKETTKINNSNYSIHGNEGKTISANTYVPGCTKDYITQGSNFIVFSASNNHIFAIFFDGTSKIKQITSDLNDTPSSYIARKIWGQPCLVHCKNKSTILTCYINGKSTQFRLYQSPNAVGATSISSDSIVEYFSGNQKYEHHNTPFSESDLYEYFKKDKAVIPSTHFDSAWVEFRKERNAKYANFLAERLSYKVSGMKHYTIDSKDEDIVNCSGNLKVQDVDGCFSDVLYYTFQYRNVKFKDEVTNYPTSASATDGKVKLTLVEGGLAPYIVNGSSLNIGDVVEVSGCGYGEKKVTVKDEKETFEYTINIPLPKHTIECKPQTCSGKGGEIVVTCEGNDLKLKSYILKRNGDVYNSTSNSDTYTFAELDLGDYKVYGVFDNGDQILLSEKETIVDNSLSVTAVVDNATKIEGKGTIKLTTQNAQGNVVWQEITENGEIEIDGKGSPISIKDVSIGRHEYRVSDSQVCSVTTTVEVFGPEISMNVDIEANEKSAYIKIEDIKPQNISNYHFEVNGQKIANFSKVPYDKTQTFTLDLKYQTTPQGEVYTYNIINQKLNSGTITISDASDKNRCSGTDGKLKIVAEDIPENVKCYYQKANVSKEETELTNGTHDVSASIVEKVVYVRQEQTFSNGQINVNIHHDSQYSVNIADGTPTDAVAIAHDVKCKGANDGYIEIRTNRDGIPQNVWLCRDEISTDQLSKTKTRIPDLEPGECVYYVVDGRCPSMAKKDTVIITEPEQKLTAVISSITNPTCRDNDGAIKLEVKGGWSKSAVYAYSSTRDDKVDTLWYEYNGTRKELVDSLPSGKNTIYITDDNGCQIHIDTLISKYVSPKVVSAYDVPTRCNGTSDGAIIIIKDTIDCFAAENLDSLFLTVLNKENEEISNAVYTTQIPNLSAGTYGLKLTDRAGCSGDIYPVTVTEPAPLTISVADTNAVRIKKKGGEGAAEISVSGGNIGYKYVIAHGDTIQQPTDDKRKVSGFKAGKSSVWAIDAKDCHSNTAHITFVEPEESLTFKATTHDARCHTETGSIVVTAQGGWNDYTIKIDGVRERKNVDSLETITFEGLYAGKYTVTVTDAEDVSFSDTIRVNAPEPIYQNYTIMPELCDDNGKVKIELSGGTKPYISWFVLKTDTIYGDAIETDQLVGGRSYRLVTVDANTCVSELNFDLPDENLQVAIQTTYTSDGIRLTANATHGTAPYTYEWQYETGNVSLGSEKALIVTKGGIYRLDVTDASGCSRSVAEPIITEGSRMMRVVSYTHETGYERNDGTALIYSPIAPQHPRMYNAETHTYSNITANDTVISLTGLRPGEYIIESEQDDGSYLFAKFSIDKYIPMEFTQLDITPVTIKGGHDGKVVIKFEGGLAPFTLDGKTYPNGYIELDSLAASTLHLLITDIAGNELSKDTTILEPEVPLTIKAKEVYNAQCYTYSDGNVTLEASGGWGNYQFAMGDSAFVISSYFGDLNAGERIFRVVDRYGVMDSVVVSITEPDQLVASIAKIDSVTCKGLSNGKVYFDVTGGTQPYYVLHDDNKLKSTEVSHLLAGRYIMKITDSHRCEAADSVEVSIPEPEKLTIERVDITHTTCDLDNGAIGINVSGGSLPYTYQWKENGKYLTDTKDISSLKQNGIYALTVSDSHNCVDTITRRVNDSRRTTIGYVYTQNATCFGYADGVAKIEPTYINAGKPAATYRLFWPQNISDVMGVNTLTAGNYSVRLEDTNGCADSTQFSIGEPVALSVNIGNDIVICPGSAHVLDAGLHTKYLWAADGNPIDNDQRYLTIDEAGEYSVEVRNEIGCFARDTMTLGIGDDALEAYFLMSTEVALGDTVALIEMANMAVDSLHWEFDTKQLTDVTTEDAEQYLRMLKPENVGTVYITMWAYANGCVTSDTKELDVYASSSEELDWDLGFNPLIVSAKATPNPCDGEFDLHVQLREVADIEVTVNHVSTTTRVARTTASGDDHYVLHLNIGQYGKGIYVLSLSCGDERRVAKILVK